MDISQSDKKDFEVAIVGGGICGLALACALANKVKIVVFEAAVKPFISW
jgi:2-polyprenyl-6-methoxyphenol hydroxylase-like FAD-dependent oxidoreductase